jgi:hypothetical protein
MASLLAGVAATSLADTPAFDRPGIAFSTTTIPRGGLAVELGTPDFVHDPNGGGSGTTYSLDTSLRTGLARNLELELAAPVYNQAGSSAGFGDTSLSLKAALPSSAAGFSWAMLGGVTFASGASEFSAGGTQYRLAASLQQQLGDRHSAGFYVALDAAPGVHGYTLSPNLNLIASPTVSGYLEAAYSHATQGPDTSVAGAGVAWMVRPTVQLDLSFDVGLTSASPQLQGGFGVSVYLDGL